VAPIGIQKAVELTKCIEGDFMTQEEEIAYLKGRVDGLSQLCSFLVATHTSGDKLTGMFKIRAEKDLNRPDLSSIAHAYASGYASLVPNIEAAQKTFGKNKGTEP
jgi:hypothetical protein